MGARLRPFLDIAPDKNGLIHGGKKRPTSIIDVALTQSLIRRDLVADLIADCGHVVIDECHHLSAMGFETLAQEAKARYTLGLSATVTRKNGHHPIIFMQCGPIRYRNNFDDARLDTLFLTMPISWRGTLAQYAGRLHRLHGSKHDVIIYDYVDENEPMLANREAGYRSLGYRFLDRAELCSIAEDFGRDERQKFGQERFEMANGVGRPGRSLGSTVSPG